MPENKKKDFQTAVVEQLTMIWKAGSKKLSTKFRDSFDNIRRKQVLRIYQKTTGFGTLFREDFHQMVVIKDP